MDEVKQVQPLSLTEVRAYEKEYGLPTLKEHPRIRSFDYLTNEVPWISFLPAFSLRTINLTVVDQLTLWALNQSTQIQQTVWAFLDEPDHQRLTATLQKLESLGVLLQEKEGGPKSKRVVRNISVAELIRRSLPSTPRQLLLLVQEQHQLCRRPAATVRQALRRMTKKGQVSHDPYTDTYRMVNPDE